MKPTKSPTQGQPNPRKTRLKVAFGPLVATANNFSWVGIDFREEIDYDKPYPTGFSANTLFLARVASRKKAFSIPAQLRANASYEY